MPAIRSIPGRARLELGLALISAVLAAVTLAWPEWIEALFRVDPDAGSGAAEWGVVFGLLLLAVILGVLGSLDLRHAASAKRRTESGL